MPDASASTVPWASHNDTAERRIPAFIDADFGAADIFQQSPSSGVKPLTTAV
jgi:hypothetical protein